MLRVPLPFRGVVALLLAASTVVGQTAEPPPELPLEPIAPQSSDFLRQYSTDARHPLLQFMADGEFVSFDAAAPDESPRLKPTPQAKSPTPSTATSPRLSEVFPNESEAFPGAIDCPEAPAFLPYACPPPSPPLCYCRKCQRQRKHAHGCNSASGCGNSYLGWPGGCPGCYGAPCSYQGGCHHKCRRKHGCDYGGSGYAGCGSPYGGGYGMRGYDGFLDGGCCGGGGSPYLAAPPPPPPPCFCRKCQRKHGGGYAGGGSPYGGGYDSMGYGGFMAGGFGGCCAPPPPPPPCRKCLRKHGYSYGYGYAGCGYPGWPAYPVPGANMGEGGYNSFTDPNCFGCCGKHQHCHGRCHRCRGCHHTPLYPYNAYPPAMPCMMEAEPCCMDCGCNGGFFPALDASGISQ